MKRYKIVLQQEQRFNLVLPYHENCSIDIEGLISMVYLDGVPIGMILDCNTAVATNTLFASAESPEQWIFYCKNDVSAVVEMYIEANECLDLKNYSALAFNEISAFSSDFNSWHLHDSTPDLRIYLIMYANECRITLNSQVAEDALVILQNAEAKLHMNIRNALAPAFNTLITHAKKSNLRLSDYAYLDMVFDVSGVSSGMTIKAAPATTQLFLPYFVEEWVDDYMSDLGDMFMAEMMYGEVIE